MRAGAAALRRKATGPVCVPGRHMPLLGDFLHGEGFDDVAFLDIVELLDGQAALVACGHLLDGVLEPLQRGQNALVDDDAVPDQAGNV